jgi:hypothetical protein
MPAAIGGAIFSRFQVMKMNRKNNLPNHSLPFHPYRGGNGGKLATCQFAKMARQAGKLLRFNNMEVIRGNKLASLPEACRKLYVGKLNLCLVFGGSDEA